MIKIAIIEDLKEVANSLKEIINIHEDMNCDDVYYNAEDAIDSLQDKEVHIVIVDIGLPRASGIEAITQISSLNHSILFCMFTVYEDDEKIFQSIQAGAKGYILKGASMEKIIESLRELYHGGSPMSPIIARKIIDIFSVKQAAPQHQDLPLTSKEIELLTLLSKGHLYKEIADAVGVSIGSIKQHFHKIYDKLQVSNRTEAINKLLNNP